MHLETWKNPFIAWLRPWRRVVCQQRGRSTWLMSWQVFRMLHSVFDRPPVAHPQMKYNKVQAFGWMIGETAGGFQFLQTKLDFRKTWSLWHFIIPTGSSPQCCILVVGIVFYVLHSATDTNVVLILYLVYSKPDCCSCNSCRFFVGGSERTRDDSRSRLFMHRPCTIAAGWWLRTDCVPTSDFSIIGWSNILRMTVVTI